MPTVLKLNKLAADKIKLYTQEATGEISGLGKIRALGNSTFLVEDVILLEQTCTGSTTDISEEGLAKFTSQLVRAGDDPSLWRFWWHSHVNMGVFWSGTDTTTMRKFGNEDWLVSMVTNKSGETLARYDQYSPVALFLDKISVVVDIPIDESLRESIKADIAEKVSSPKYTGYQGYCGHGYQNYGGEDYHWEKDTGGNWVKVPDDEEDWLLGRFNPNTKTETKENKESEVVPLDTGDEKQLRIIAPVDRKGLIRKQIKGPNGKPVRTILGV